jgi:serine protease SohB
MTRKMVNVEPMPDQTPFERVRAVVGPVLGPLVPARFRSDIPVVPVVRLAGAIGISSPLRPGLTISSVSRSLERAFAISNVKAVALSINSPGGAAVQSHLIFKRIRALADEKKVPVFAFVEDVAASGGYMIACAADEIICDNASVVGSIGVIGASFGFHKLIDKIGVERRVYTAGQNKAMLDPFQPEKPEDVERFHKIQQDIHEGFIALVKSRRGTKLDSRETALFSGEFWTGRRGLELERYGEKVRMPLIAERGLFGRSKPGVLGGVTEGGLASLWEGPSLTEDVVATLEARALWARYGL